MRAAAISLALFLCAAGPVAAAPAEVVWPTYLRTGPDQRYAVIDEVTRGMKVDVLSCDGDWCQARLEDAAGYIERSALAQGPDAPRFDAKSRDCFDSPRSGYAGGELWRFCR